MNAADKPVALVLAGGGSFGAVQVGMLHALMAHGVKADMMVGSSVGAINGAYFAGAPNAQGVARLEAIWCSLRRNTLFPLAWRGFLGLAGRQNFAVDPSGLRRLLEQCLPYSSFEEAHIPLHVVTTDLLGGGTVSHSDGPVVDAILASCAIPAIFPPVHLGGKFLIDGAIASNTPISVAIELGAQRIIVLPSGYACALEAPPRNALASALHALTLLISHQLVTELALYKDKAEIVTVPPLCPLNASPYDFSRASELIGRAAEQTARWIERGGLERQQIPAGLMAHTH